MKDIIKLQINMDAIIMMDIGYLKFMIQRNVMKLL